MAEDYKKSRASTTMKEECAMKHIKTLNTKKLTEHCEKKVDAVSARHPASPHVRLLAP